MSFASTITQAHQSLRSLAGVEITYQRGDDTTELTAIPGQTTFQVADISNLLTEYRSRDYIFAAADLDLDQPRKGDVIIEGSNRYEVLRPDGGDDVWRWSDTAGQIYRVHTKYIGVVTEVVGPFSSAFSTAFKGGK